MMKSFTGITNLKFNLKSEIWDHRFRTQLTSTYMILSPKGSLSHLSHQLGTLHSLLELVELCCDTSFIGHFNVNTKTEDSDFVCDLKRCSGILKVHSLIKDEEYH